MTRCAATTRGQTRCQNRALPDRSYCTLHTVPREPTDKTCPTCHVRWRVKLPHELTQAPSTVTPQMYRWLVDAAETFMKEAEGEPFTVADFVWWIKLDLLGHAPIPESVGRNLIEAPNKRGTKPTSHGNPFPLPVLDRRDAA